MNENQLWYKTVLDTINEGVILQSDAGEILAFNKGAEKILGISAAEILGQRREDIDFNLIHEDGTKYEVKDYSSTITLKTGKSFRNIVMGVYRTPEDLRWLSVNTNPLYKNDNEKPYAVVISFSDITELKVEKDTSKNYLDIAGVIIVALNSKGEIILINRKGCELLGCAEDELLGKNWFDLFTPKEVLDNAKDLYQDIVASRIMGDGYNEYKILNLSGVEKIIAWNHTYLKDKDGNIIGTLSSGEDITEKKRAEVELRESEKRWQFALEGAGDGLWDWNAETNKVFFSRRWKEMLGFSENEIEEKLDEWDSRIHPDDRTSVYEDLNAHFIGETDIYQNEHRILCKDGSYKWILDRGKVIERTGDGKPLRVIGTHSDISDRKKWELEREKLIAELKEALDQVKTLSGLLPICANCKKIRDDKGYWNQIETYIHEHSQAQFSHSICPECAKKLYPDFDI